MNTRLQEKIDQYHAGRLSSDEMSVLEKELASDPSLQAESNFQSDIINGLKEFRKSELKSRLNGIEVNPAWFDFIQQSTLLKSFGGVAVATLIGTGVFLSASNNSSFTSLKVFKVVTNSSVLLSSEMAAGFIFQTNF